MFKMNVESTIISYPCSVKVFWLNTGTSNLVPKDMSSVSITRYILQLHANCDFIIENYDLRKAARENELTSLANAKSVLSGANFS